MFKHTDRVDVRNVIHEISLAEVNSDLKAYNGYTHVTASSRFTQRDTATQASRCAQRIYIVSYAVHGGLPCHLANFS